jgi:hypothetical protein
MQNDTETTETTPSVIKSIVIKRPPPQSKGIGLRQKSEDRIQIESMKPGECLEIRNFPTDPRNRYTNMIFNASKATGKKFTTRSVGANGLDIYCIA